MIDHTGLYVSSVAKSKAFYAAALAPLGYTLLMEFDGGDAGFGVAPQPDFWIGQGEVGTHTHVAFRAESRRQVDDFYSAAISSGGKDNGAPGLRPQYHENYYGAFVLDPDGHNIEAVCHAPQ